MPNQSVDQSVEFTAEAQRTLEERTKAFAEELRLAAIEEAIRRRGSASEVNASDVLRAAAGALEQESLKAYEKKIDTLAKMLEEQSARSQMSAAEISQILTKRLESLAGAVGMNKEREKELQALYQRLQEKSFASAAEFRNMLSHELRSLRSTLAEEMTFKSRPLRPAERLAWLYIFAGSLLAFLGTVASLTPIVLKATDSSVRIFALMGIGGITVAFTGGVILSYLRFRRGPGFLP